MISSQQTIGFIGSGHMASALIGGLIANGLPAQQIIASDPDPAKGQTLAEQYPIRVTQDNQAVVNTADLFVLAVKPQLMQQVVEPIRDTVQQRKPVVISIAAGIRTEALQTWLGGDIALVRCMPNTPAFLQAGATGLYATPQVSAGQKQLAESILASVGITCWLDHEADLDAVTAISGSGPAYFFLVLEAMEQAGKQFGLSAATARQLSAQTALGAARMVLEGCGEPAELRARVTSPGGTTERAIQSLQHDQLEEIMRRALITARDRAIELSH